MTFELYEPPSVEEAIFLLSKYGDEARVIGGGQSLLLMIRAGLLRPQALISAGGLSDLKGVESIPGGRIRLGALTTHRHILSSDLVQLSAGILGQTVRQIGSTPVRNFGTIGGNLCHNEMGSDPPTGLLVLDATVECLSRRGARKLPLSEFLTDYFGTSLAPDEILTGIEIAAQPRESRAVYLKHTMRPGDLAIVGAAVLLDMKNGSCQEARIALGGVGPVAFRATEAEILLMGKPLSEELIEEAGIAAAAMSDPISDAHASADYRKKMARVFVKRAIRRAVQGGQG